MERETVVVAKTVSRHYQNYTSAKIFQLNEWGYRDEMHLVKNCGNKEVPLAILSRKLAQSCVTFKYLPNYTGRGYARFF